MSISGIILLGFLAAAVVPGVHRLVPRVARLFAPAVPLALTVQLCTLVPAVTAGVRLEEQRVWVEQLGLALSWRIDGLSLLFALLIAGIGTLVILYAGAYLEGHPLLGRFYGFILLFMASMLGVVLTDNALALFVFWELTSISSYFLIGFFHEREQARSAALQALLVTGSGGLALLAGVVLLSHAAGTYEISRMSRDALAGHALHTPIVVLVLGAALTKSAQFPFHSWLPRAMEAPAPVSAYLHAATMVKAGIYLLARLSPILSGSLVWSGALITVGLSTMLLGAGLSLYQRQFKRILAYSTVSALGMMTLLIGLGGALALQTMIVLVTAHATYKGALFLVAGAVDHAAHETDVEELGALRRVMPMTSVAAVLAALSMGGLPPLFGWISKELVFTTSLAMVHGAASTAAVLVANALSFAVAVMVGVRPFWLPRHGAPALPIHEVPWPLWSAPLLLAAFGAVLGLWPGVAEPLVRAATRAASGEDGFVELHLWHGVGAPLALSAATFALGLVLYRARSSLRRWAQPLAPLVRFGPDRGYALALSGLGGIARAQTRILQRGYLRGYLVIILCAAMGLIGHNLLGRGGLPSSFEVGDLRFYEGVIALMIVVAAVSAIRSTSRIASILSLGVVGFGVALVFLLFGAPDLGITQLVVETLTIILLVSAFYHLPGFAELSSRASRARDVAVAVGFGALMTALVLLAAEIPLEHPVSRHYGELSLTEGHGRNVVNVILVDFRALDTLGEITVLAVAAFGGLALMKLRPSGGVG
ncbi:DUF4040 domain-containing protein [Myxococcota bacterium]|nr:DUF4040 domain-containing protein [Myxococcota bacterium]